MQDSETRHRIRCKVTAWLCVLCTLRARNITTTLIFLWFTLFGCYFMQYSSSFLKNLIQKKLHRATKVSLFFCKYLNLSIWIYIFLNKIHSSNHFITIKMRTNWKKLVEKCFVFCFYVSRSIYRRWSTLSLIWTRWKLSYHSKKKQNK